MSREARNYLVLRTPMLLLIAAVGALPVSGSCQEITATRDLTIPADQHDLSEVLFVDVFNDGTIVASQPGDRRVVLFSAEGNPVGAFGRPGAGPGEFRTLARLHGFKGDTLWLWDGNLLRVTLVTRTGDLVRSLSMPPSLTDGTGRALSGLRSVTPMALTSDGALVGRAILAPVPGLLPEGWVRHDPNGGMATFSLRFDGRVTGPLLDGDPHPRSVCGTELSMQSECPRHMHAVSRDGTLVVRVAPEIGPSGNGVAKVHITEAPSGRTTILRIPIDLVRIPEYVIDSIRADLVKVLAGTRMEQYWRTAEFPEYYRPITNLFIGRDRTIWFALHPTEKGRLWTVLNPDGSLYGRMTVPSNIDIDSGDKTTFWGRERREDDLDDVVRFRLSRPR